MNWNHLYCFYEVAKHNSVKKAAASMGLVPSTVSEQVKRLEETNSLTLFERRGREIFLTSDGDRVFSYAREMFDKGKKLVDAIGFNEAAGYNVGVAIENHLESGIVDNFMSSYWKQYSDFGLVETKRSKNLSQSLYFLEHDVTDWVLTSSKIGNEKYQTEYLGELKCSIFTSSRTDLPQDHRDRVRSLPLALYGNSDSVRGAVKTFLLNMNVNPKELLEAEHLSLLQNLCLAGEVNLIMPTGFNDPGLIPLDLTSSLGVPLYAVWKKENTNLLFIRKLQELILQRKLNLE